MASETMARVRAAIARRARVVPLALALAAGSLTARPVGAAEPTEAEKESARTLMDEGDKRVQARDYLGALQSYQAADALMHVPTTTIEVAKTLATLGKLVEAAEAAAAVLRYPQQSDEPVPFQEARRDAASLMRVLSGMIATVQLTVVGPDPAKVVLHVDGVVRDSAGSIALNPGKHVLEASADGFRDARRALSVRQGERVGVALELQPLGPRVPARSEAGASPVATTLVPVGFAVAAVGVAAGAVFGALSLTRAARAKDQCEGTSCPETARDDIDAAETYANVSNVAFLAGIGGGITGVIGLVLSRRGPRSRSVSGANFVVTSAGATTLRARF